MYPQRKYRHEKPDVKLLLERKEDDYVDVAQAACPEQQITDPILI